MLYNKYFLFDVDGTLINSLPFWEKAMLNVLNKNNVKYPKNVISVLRTKEIKETAEYFISIGLNKPIFEIINDINNELTPMYQNEILLKPNVKKTLLALKNKGFKLYVLSASPHIFIDDCLKRNEIFNFFNNIWCCDDFGLLKSDKEIYLKVAKKINENINNMVFLDDSISANLAAKEAGAKVIGVFDDSNKKDYKKQKALCHGYITDFSMLLNYI